MANIAFSTPFTKSFTHSDTTVGTSASQIVAPTPNPYDRRVMLVIQNKSDTAVIQIIFAATGSVGLELQPNQSCTLENYNGAVQDISDTAGTTFHIAETLV
ncbi:MAG: hypothetical protein ACR2IJ_08405 [Fluviibacter sp.]